MFLHKCWFSMRIRRSASPEFVTNCWCLRRHLSPGFVYLLSSIQSKMQLELSTWTWISLSFFHVRNFCEPSVGLKDRPSFKLSIVNTVFEDWLTKEEEKGNKKTIQAEQLKLARNKDYTLSNRTNRRKKSGQTDKPIEWLKIWRSEKHKRLADGKADWWKRGVGESVSTNDSVVFDF